MYFPDVLTGKTISKHALIWCKYEIDFIMDWIEPHSLDVEAFKKHFFLRQVLREKDETWAGLISSLIYRQFIKEIDGASSVISGGFSLMRQHLISHFNDDYFFIALNDKMFLVTKIGLCTIFTPLIWY
jgi:hypothetical protein